MQPKYILEIKHIAVIGSGAMGRGIGQLFAQAECSVVMVDTSATAISAAKDYFSSTLSKLLDKGKLDQATHDDVLSRITYSEDLSACSSCDLVIEAIVENLDIKRELFKKLELIVSPQTILVSNTSSLSITAIAAVCQRPEQIAGLHFFNPVPLMKVVEIVYGAVSAKATIEALKPLIAKTRHKAVMCKDTPGFIVNHAGRGYGTEALRALGEGVAGFVEIDAILREQVLFESGAGGFKLGPFELLDLTGLDVSHPVMESIYHQYFEEPRYRPSVITKQRMDAKLFGRKTKRGFYEYSTGIQQALEQDKTPPLPIADDSVVQRFWVAPGKDQPAICELLERLGAPLDTNKHPAEDSIQIVAPWGTDATTEAVAKGCIARKVIAIDTLFGFGFKACKRRVLMSTPATDMATRAYAATVFSRDGAKVSIINDSAGFIAQRVCAMIINIACEIAQQQVASPDDIDVAVQLGLGYPLGPLSMGNALGAKPVFELLTNLQATTGDDRFRPSLWLRRRAQLDLSLLHS